MSYSFPTAQAYGIGQKSLEYLIIYPSKGLPWCKEKSINTTEKLQGKKRL